MLKIYLSKIKPLDTYNLQHTTCFKVSGKINQSDVLAKFCPTFLMTMIRHETGPFYRRPSEYAASLGEQTLTHQRYREKLSSLGLDQRGWVELMVHFKIWGWNNWLLVSALFTSLLRALISGGPELSIRVTNFSQFLLRQVQLILLSCLFQF